ncbi:hypothetical protein DUNSADRAFT_7588, partial [Dunaliella salina]
MLCAHLLSAQGDPDGAAHVLLDAYQQQQRQQQHRQQKFSPSMLHQAPSVEADGVLCSSTCHPTVLAPTTFNLTQAAVLNNVGLLHHQAGRPHLAVTLLERALHQLQHKGRQHADAAAAGAAGGAVRTAPFSEVDARVPAAKETSHRGVDSSSSSGEGGSVVHPHVSAQGLNSVASAALQPLSSKFPSHPNVDAHESWLHPSTPLPAGSSCIMATSRTMATINPPCQLPAPWPTPTPVPAGSSCVTATSSTSSSSKGCLLSS